jgi:hypothetical protein
MNSSKIGAKEIRPLPFTNVYDKDENEFSNDFT